jgi:glucokinase
MSLLLGLDLGGTNIKGVLLDPKTLKTVHRLQVPTYAGRGAAAVIETMTQTVKELAARAKSENKRIAGLGIGSAGLVHQGTVRNSPNLPGWQGAVPLLRLLKAKLRKPPLPLVIDNDANCFVLAESFCGAARGHRNVIGLTLGTGVGGGIMIGGRLYRGSTGGAGELGHVSIKLDGPACLCGNKGCLEAMAGANSILTRYKGLTSKFRIQNAELTVEEISALAKKGDRSAVNALAETGTLLGVALANYVNIFNPEMIVIGGGVAQAGKHLMEPAVAEMKQRAMPFNAAMVKVKPARLGPWAGAIGAALLNKGTITLK